MNTKYIVFICFALIFSVSQNGCMKVPLGTPKCVKKHIKDSEICWKAVYRYEYLDEKVYYFIPDHSKCTDNFSMLVNEDCKPLYDSDNQRVCASAGGGSPQKINCEDFLENRTNEKLIWEKDR